MSWYRQYRPRTVAGLHLTSVRERLLQLMAQGKLPQVMLFAGPKGTGKTSTARIMAAVLNDPANAAMVDHLFFHKAKPKTVVFNEPTTKDQLLENIFKGTSYVVQELDAASNRGIDDVRAIKERVHLAPQDGKMSVYILDEVHMLTTEAFNALLKLLEEPPAHAVFILATTELHKIPGTVTSRATLIPFTRATPEEISQAVSSILDAEKIAFEPDALALLGQYADGSFRDAVKLAEVLSQNNQKLTEDLVRQHLALSSVQQMQSLIEAVIEKNPQEIVSIINQLREDKVDATYFLKSLCQWLHTDLMKALTLTPGKAFTSAQISRFLLQEISQLPPQDSSPLPLLSLELKLLDLVFRSQSKEPKGGATVRKTVTSPPSEDPKPETSTLEAPGLPAATLIPITSEVKEAILSDNLSNVAEGDADKLLEQWDHFVDLVKGKNTSLAALLKSAQASAPAHGVAQVKVFYRFHKEQLQQPKFLAMLEECVQPLTGGRIKFEFIVSEPPVAQAEENLSALAEELLV